MTPPPPTGTPGTISPKELAFGDVDRELTVTRRVLERLPADRFAWKPHEKSMSLGRLAMHVATLPQWMTDTLEKDGMDMNVPPQVRHDEPKDREDLLAEFDRHAAATRAALARIDEAALSRPWTLRKGEQVIHRAPRAAILRVWCVNHLVHHRAQLCVLLRLLDVPVPAVYFNSADEPEWTFA
jgi:uncharacterized damage-inducible protein DinB